MREAGTLTLAAPRRPNKGLLAAGMAIAILVLLPIGVTAVNALGAGWNLAVTLLWRPLTFELLQNTLALIGCVTIACALIGTGTAWMVERTDLPGRKLWGVLAVVPLAIPAFISSYAWLSLDSVFANFGGALLVVTMS